jgi:hypothetical protein
MNTLILLALFLILICIFTKVKIQENFQQGINESLTKKEMKFPSAVALIKNGSVNKVILTNGTELKPEFWSVSLNPPSMHLPNFKPAEIIWNNDMSFTIKNPGNGYITPPEIVFFPKEKEKLTKSKDTITIEASGLWDDIPQNTKNELADMTQDFLRTQKYSESIRENVFSLGILQKVNETEYLIEWMYPIEFSEIKIYYNNTTTNQTTIKFIQILGYNENGVELFVKDLIFSPLVQWSENYLLKKLIIKAPKWDSCEIFARRVYWTCEEYEDFVEQLKESKDTAGAPSSKFEDDDTTIVYSELMQQIPSDFSNTGKSKDFYIDYYSNMMNQCYRKTSSQLEAERIMEEQQVEAYKQDIEKETEKRSAYKEKMIRDYQRMVEQYNLDLENQKDAKKYGIPEIPFKYSKQEIDDLKKRIESVKNIPEEVLIKNCSGLERKYNKQRSKAEKWAKASIFLPFLKKKAKRESRKAEKTENKYNIECSELMSLAYAY